jgi:hypothetical protein
MAKLPWLAAGRYVPLLFYWSQARGGRSDDLAVGQEPWPPIKIGAASALVDVGEKDLPGGRAAFAKARSRKAVRSDAARIDGHLEFVISDAQLRI